MTIAAPNIFTCTFQFAKRRACTLWTTGRKKYAEFSQSSYYEAITPFSIASNRCKYLASYFFRKTTSAFPLTELSTSPAPFSKVIYNFVMSETLTRTTNFLMLGSLFFETQAAVEEQKQAIISGNKEKKMDSNLKNVALVGKYLYAPTTIRKFSIALNYSINSSLTLASNICGVVSLLLSTVEIILTERRRRSTITVAKQLKRVSRLAFVTAYQEATEKHLEQSGVGNFSELALKNRVKEIKYKLKETNNSSCLESMSYAANQAFIHAASQMIKSDPETIQRHFRMHYKKLEFTEGPHIVEHLTTLENQTSGENLSKGVSLIKKRLNQKIHSDIFSIVNKIIIIIPSSITFLVIFTPLNPLFLPIGASISLLAALASLIHIAFVERQKRAFTEGIAQLIA